MSKHPVNKYAFELVEQAKAALAKEKSRLDETMDEERIKDIRRALMQLNDAQVHVVGDNPWPTRD